MQVTNADAEVLRLAVYELYPARQGRAEDVMTASLRSRTQSLLAVHISELDRKLVTATEGTSCLGWSTRTRLAWHDLNMQAHCVHAATRTHHTKYNTSTSVLIEYACLCQLVSSTVVCCSSSAALFVSQLRRNSVSLPDERETVTEHISYFSTFSLIRQDQTLQARPC